jgi:hypothetical protein
MEPDNQRHSPNILLLLTPRFLPRPPNDRLDQPKRDLLTRSPTSLNKQFRHHAPTRRKRTKRKHSLLHLYPFIFPPQPFPLQWRYSRYSGSRRASPSLGLRTLLVRRTPPHSKALSSHLLSTLRRSGKLGKQHQPPFFRRRTNFRTTTLLRPWRWRLHDSHGPSQILGVWAATAKTQLYAHDAADCGVRRY